MAIVIDDEPTPQQRRENELPDGETLYGLYEGVPRTEYGRRLGRPPRTGSRLFRLPLEEDFADVPAQPPHGRDLSSLLVTVAGGRGTGNPANDAKYASQVDRALRLSGPGSDRVTVPGAGHLTFTDAPLFLPPVRLSDRWAELVTVAGRGTGNPANDANVHHRGRSRAPAQRTPAAIGSPSPARATSPSPTPRSICRRSPRSSDLWAARPVSKSPPVSPRRSSTPP